MTIIFFINGFEPGWGCRRKFSFLTPAPNRSFGTPVRREIDRVFHM